MTGVQTCALPISVLFLKDLPTSSEVDLSVEEPSVYFGELSNDYVIVNTDTREFHYPQGDDNVYSTYTGESGVPIGGLFQKLWFSLRFRAFNLLISKQLTPESKILIHRNIVDRAETIAPFLEYDRDPYMVISEGRLFWILDAYKIGRASCRERV